MLFLIRKKKRIYEQGFSLEAMEYYAEQREGCEVGMMIIDEWGDKSLTVSELKQKLEELEIQGYGDYIPIFGYNKDCLYTVNDESPKVNMKNKEVFFDSDD